MKKIFRWLDRTFAPVPCAKEYMSDALETAQLELAKALDQRDYYSSMVAYREAQIARLTTKISIDMPTP
jgi:hypothetical protein